MHKEEIILSHFRVGKSRWKIHKETDISKKTIEKYIKEYEKNEKTFKIEENLKQ
jgi:transposase